MSESEESLLKAISHYQNGLERYLQRQDEAKMLHNLGRLYKLPIKVCHLEKTGVGRTVNSLRKLEGEVGEAAKSLVARWKEMVVQEEENEAVDCSSQDERSYDVPEHREESQSSSHINTTDDRKSGDCGKSSSERHQSSKSKSHSRSSSHEKKHKERSKKRSHSSSEENTDDHEDIKNSSSDNSDDMKKNKIKQKERKSDVNSKNNHKSSRESKNKSKHSSEDDESEFDNHKSKKESKHESNDKNKHHHKSSHSCKEEISKNKIKDEKKHDSSKHDKEKKKDHKERESKDQREDKHKKSKHSDKTPKIELLGSSSSSSSNNNKKERNDKNKLVKSAPYTAVINGIGSESGTSFEDALGMCGPPPSKKKKSTQHEKQKYSSPVLDNEEENVPGVLPLPKDPLENLDINISSLLPLITPHYRPLGLPVDDQPKKMLTDDEALSRVMMNKNQRTKVYSGNKVAYGKIPTLFDICVRILQDNIDALEYTGGVPYSILKPILEKATANQLYMLEHHNPYLIDDSDELWKLHCQTEFRNKKKEEMETWRDMYMRCLDEREAKLKALTANIKQSQDKSLPVRTTKLAYVDSVAKPPRNIARKQKKRRHRSRKKRMTYISRVNCLRGIAYI
ncbi:hypothetical protein WA026_003847 [Henosepilachna vigintioctopunctata]|uniref:TFIIS N-terminal domain-containing protein n=1 Tax=Henosepilachna vigintioctopunctata TaxID=420089 RepID=A0AAW1U5W4_9CUCU